MKLIKRLLCLMNGHDNSILLVSEQKNILSCSRCSKGSAIWMKNLKKN